MINQYLKLILNMISVMIYLHKTLDKYYRKKKIKKELYKSIEKTLEEFGNASKTVIEDFSSFLIPLVVFDHNEFKKYLENKLKNLDQHLEYMNECAIKVFKILNYHRDSLKEVLDEKKWFIIEPFLNMISNEGKINWAELYSVGHINTLLSDIYKSEKEIVKTTEKNLRLLFEKTTPVLEKHYLNITTENYSRKVEKIIQCIYKCVNY